MRKVRFFVSGAVLMALAGCESAGNPTPAAAVGNAAQQVAQLCQAGGQLIAEVQQQAPSPTSTAGNLLAYAQSSCTADGAVAAALAPNVDATTPAWLKDVLTGLQVAAQVAPVVLPLVGA